MSVPEEQAPRIVDPEVAAWLMRLVFAINGELNRIDEQNAQIIELLQSIDAETKDLNAKYTQLEQRVTKLEGTP